MLPAGRIVFVSDNTTITGDMFHSAHLNQTPKNMVETGAIKHAKPETLSVFLIFKNFSTNEANADRRKIIFRTMVGALRVKIARLSISSMFQAICCQKITRFRVSLQ